MACRELWPDRARAVSLRSLICRMLIKPSSVGSERADLLRAGVTRGLGERSHLGRVPGRPGSRARRGPSAPSGSDASPRSGLPQRATQQHEGNASAAPLDAAVDASSDMPAHGRRLPTRTDHPYPDASLRRSSALHASHVALCPDWSSCSCCSRSSTCCCPLALAHHSASGLAINICDVLVEEGGPRVEAKRRGGDPLGGSHANGHFGSWAR